MLETSLPVAPTIIEAEESITTLSCRVAPTPMTVVASALTGSTGGEPAQVTPARAIIGQGALAAVSRTMVFIFIGPAELVQSFCTAAQTCSSLMVTAASWKLAASMVVARAVSCWGVALGSLATAMLTARAAPSVASCKAVFTRRPLVMSMPATTSERMTTITRPNIMATLPRTSPRKA